MDSLVELRDARKKKLKLKKKNDNLRREEKKQRAALARLTKKLGPIGGVGHFEGDESCPLKGGDRCHMDDRDLRRVLRTLHYGAEKVNFKECFVFIFFNLFTHNMVLKFNAFMKLLKLFASQDVTVEECGWKIKYIGCEKHLITGEIRGDGFHHFYLEKIGDSTTGKSNFLEQKYCR